MAHINFGNRLSRSTFETPMTGRAGSEDFSSSEKLQASAMPQRLNRLVLSSTV